MTSPDTRPFDHPLPRDQWPAFVGKRPDAEIARSPGLSAAEQLRIAHHHRPRTRAALAGNPSIGYDVQRILADDAAAVLALAANPSLCEEVQLELLIRGDPAIIRAVATSAVLAKAVREALADNPKYRSALARNPHLPSEVYEQLSHDRSTPVRMSLAGNPAADPDLLMGFARSRDDDVRRRVAGNPSLPPAAHQRLSTDLEAHVRQALAGNPGLTARAQTRMAANTEGVQLVLASNPALTPDVIDLLSTASVAVQSRLAARRGLETSQQLRLARQSPPWALNHLAANPSLCPELHEPFSEHAARSVRAALAGNPALLPAAQRRLAREDDRYLRTWLVANPALDRSALAILLDARASGQWRWHPDDTPRVPALGLATHWTPASLDHPVLGPLVALLTGKAGVLSAAVEHPDPLVRLALVGNDRVGANRLGVLITDPEPAIAAGARSRFFAGLAG